MISPRKILLVRPDHLGDVILSLPVAEALKRAFPESIIFYLAAPGPTGLSGMVTYVDSWISNGDIGGKNLSIASLKSIYQDKKFDTVIELKPALRTALVGYLAHIDHRIGTSRRAYSLFYNELVDVPRKSSGRHQTDLDLSMLQPLGIDEQGNLPELKITQRCISKAHELIESDLRPYIVIHPTNGGSSPNWPMNNYEKLSQMIVCHTDYKAVITGLNHEILPFDNCLDATGKTDIEALAGIIYGAKIFISGSTGPLHLADALGIPCVSFFINHPVVGPGRWGPRRNIKNIMMSDTPCHCRGLSACRCLEQVTVEAAFKKIMELLE